MNQPARQVLYEFGEFQLDTATRLLRSRTSGEPIPLTGRVFDTLLYLLEHHGELIDKTTLMKAVWPNVVVEENNLTQNISILRRALEERPGEHRFVVTESGRGYRFVADVRRIEPEVPTKPAAATTVPVTAKPRRTVVWVAGTVTGIVLLAGAAALWLHPRATPDSAPIRSLAVLPFKPVVARERNDSLELGMADTLITRLSRISDMTVPPLGVVRSYGGLEQDPAAAGRELGVQAVLDGTIQHSGDRLRVSARLVRVADGRHLWASQFDQAFTDLFAVQDAIAERVLSALAIELTVEDKKNLYRRYTDDPVAWQLAMSGLLRFRGLEPGGMSRAIDYFGQAIERDPKFAVPYALRSYSHALLAFAGVLVPRDAFRQARQDALRAVALDPEFAPAHVALGIVKAQYDFDWAGAEESFRRAIAVDPNVAESYGWLSMLDAYRGQFDRAIEEVRYAAEIEPHQLIFEAQVGACLYYARRYDEAITHLQALLEIDENRSVIHSYLGRAYLRKGNYERAIAEFTLQRRPSPGSTADLPQAYALAGRRDEAWAALALLLEKAKSQYVSAYDLASIYASLGDTEQALRWLTQAMEERAPLLPFVHSDPAFDSLRSDARFARTLAPLGLPAAQR